jgi:hypothetical protein
MIKNELIDYHEKIYKSYCDDLGKIVDEIGQKGTLLNAIDPLLCAEESVNLSIKTIYDYVFDEKKLTYKKDKIKETLWFYVMVEFKYRKSDENIPMLFNMYQLLASFQNHKKNEIDKVKATIKTKIHNERKQLRKEFDKEVKKNS